MQVQLFWREATAGLVLLVTMDSVMGSLPVAASQARLPDGEVIRTPTPSLRLALPSSLTDEVGSEPSHKPDVLPVTDGIGSSGNAENRLDFQVQVTSTAATDATPSLLPNTDPSDPTPDKIVATLQTESLLARVGPQTLSYDSLIHKDHIDHGATVALDFGGRTLVKGFGMLSGERGGYQRLLGSDRARFSLNGVVAEHKLPAPDGGAVKLVAAWLSGNARPAGADESTGQGAGDAWSVSADTALLEQRMQLHFEYAGSSFDWQHDENAADTPGADMGQYAGNTAHAYSFGTEFQSARSSAITWRLGTQFDQVAPRFGSLANPTLGNDWRSLRTYAALDTGEWKFDLSLDRRQSNLEGNPAVPILQSRKGRVAASWTPAQAPAAVFLGSPSYKLIADFGQSESTDEAGATEPEQKKERAVSLMLQTEFKHADWLWGVRAKGGEMPGPVDAGENNGVRTLALHLYGDIAAGALKPTVSWQRHLDQETRTIDQRWSAGLNSSEFALRDDLAATVKLGYQHRFRSDTGRGDNAFSLGTNLKWQLRRPSAGSSGLTLSVSGDYFAGDRRLASAAGNDDYRLILSLSTDPRPHDGL